jgi:hypothetical protein
LLEATLLLLVYLIGEMRDALHLRPDSADAALSILLR